MLGQRTLQVMGLALTALGTFALGCGSSDNPTSSGGGGGSTGTGGSGNGGTPSTGGGGLTDGGAGGSISDAAGDGATTCNDTPMAFCMASPPARALIADFTLAADAAAPLATCDGNNLLNAYGTYGDEYFGGTYVYPTLCGNACILAQGPSTTPLSQALGQGNWHITGQVGIYSGFGIYMSHRTAPIDPATGTAPYAGNPYSVMDASMYRGIQFTISGDAGATGSVILQMGSAATTVSTDTQVNDLHPLPGRTFTTCGTCLVTPCGNADVIVPVTSTPTTKTVTWAEAGITDPNAFMTVSWRFSYTTGAAPYPVDVTVDDIQFVP
jgi:hypothetical protein